MTPTQARQQYVAPSTKPRLRGRFHALAALLALGMTVWLALRDVAPAMRAALILFGACSTLLYTVSAIYHIGDWRDQSCRLWRTFDHANIYLLIAATYTPFCLVILDGFWLYVMLGTLWVAATIGVLLKVLRPFASRGVTTALYAGMGWFGIFLIPRLVHVLPLNALWVLLAAGICYSVGGVIYALRKPTLIPNIFGFHELFHVLGVVANGLFLLAMVRWVLPLAS